jgi:ribosomal protein S18 acetylase RimI-like enzyme
LAALCLSGYSPVNSYDTENLNQGTTVEEPTEMSMNSEIRIRPATADDKDFIISLLPRLVEFGPPSWRDIDQIIATDTRLLSEKFLDQPPGTAIYIAEDASGIALGFIHLQTGTDYYNHDEHGHIADLVVAPAGEGRGLGRLLIEKGEEWARAQGYRWLTLNVFAQNLRAREIYKRLGYGEDIMKYVKELG